MNFEELHNEINSFPEELNYTEASWEGALKVIKAHERKQAAKKWGLISLFAFFISFGGYSALQSETNHLTDYEPRLALESDGITSLFQYESQPRKTTDVTPSISPSSEELTEETRTIEGDELAALGQVTSKVVQRSDGLVNNSIENEIAESESKRLTEHPNVDVTEERTIVDPSEKNPALGMETPPSDASTVHTESGPKTEEVNHEEHEGVSEIVQAQSTLPAEIDLTQDRVNEAKPIQQLNASSNHYQFTPYLVYINSKLPNLKINSPSRLMKGEKQDIQSQRRFSAPLAFTGIKFGAIPMAEFGRTNKFFKTDISVGAFVQKPIAEKLGVNFGMDYMEISGMETPVSSMHTTFGFGFENQITTVHTHKVQFLSVPLNLTYNVNPRIQIETGFGLDYILDSKNILEQHVQTNSKFETISEEQTTGYFASYNRALLNTNFGVSYWLSSKYKIGANYQFGLSDLTKNEEFNSESVDRNTRLNFTLRRVIR